MPLRQSWEKSNQLAQETGGFKIGRSLLKPATERRCDKRMPKSRLLLQLNLNNRRKRWQGLPTPKNCEAKFKAYSGKPSFLIIVETELSKKLQLCRISQAINSARSLILFKTEVKANEFTPETEGKPEANQSGRKEPIDDKRDAQILKRKLACSQGHQDHETENSPKSTVQLKDSEKDLQHHKTTRRLVWVPSMAT
nr:hypothetical protein Iba_chr12cCG10720 [Ipomoea batatas]